MSTWTAFSEYNWHTAPGATAWGFAFFSDPSPFTYQSASSSSTRLVYTQVDGTKSYVNGSGLSVDGVGYVHFTTITSLEHIAANGSTIERIDNTVALVGPTVDLRNLSDLIMAGNDTLTGSAGRDLLKGGHDRNDGPDANDVITGGGGADRLIGGNGDDTFRYGPGDLVAGESISGGLGTDTIQLENVGSFDLRAAFPDNIEVFRYFSGTSNVIVRLDQLFSVTTITGSAGVDTLNIMPFNNYTVSDLSTLVFNSWTTGQDKINITVTGASLIGTTRNDNFILGTGAAVMKGVAGDDVFTLSSGNYTNTTFDGGIGTDRIELNATNLSFLGFHPLVVVITGVEQLVFKTGQSTVTLSNAAATSGTLPTFVGSAAVDKIVLSGVTTLDASHLVLSSWNDAVDKITITDTGNNVPSRLTGSSHADTLDGGNGADTMLGGLGNDTYLVDDIHDAIVEKAGQGTADRVQTSTTFTLGKGDSIEFLEALKSPFVTGINLTGNEFANTITGNALDNKLAGKAGADTLLGGAGKDTLTGGTGRDTMSGGGGADHFDFNAVSEMGSSAKTRDVITDFSTGGGDLIDLATLDGNGSDKGSAFTFLKAQGAKFTGDNGDLRWYWSGNNTIVAGDIDGDKKADFQIALSGHLKLMANDFIL